MTRLLRLTNNSSASLKNNREIAALLSESLVNHQLPKLNKADNKLLTAI